jgi:tetratricopeptide (TPR) repeat protein
MKRLLATLALLGLCSCSSQDLVQTLNDTSEQAYRHEQAYRQKIAENPKSGDAHFQFALFLKENGRLEEAKAEHRRALAVEPKFLQAHVGLGDIAALEERYSDAIVHYKKALSQPHVHTAICSSHVQLKNYTEAIKHCEIGIRQDPHDGVAWYNLGTASGEKGQARKALQAFKKYVELADTGDETDPFVQHSNVRIQQLEYLLSHKSEREIAMDAARPVHRYTTQEEASWSEIRSIYLAQGMSEEGADEMIGDMKKMWSKFPPSKRLEMIRQTTQMMRK